MPLSHFTRQLIDIRYNDLVSRIKQYEEGTGEELIPETLADYRNDERILYKLLSGQYEELEEDNMRLQRHSLMSGE